MHVSHWFKYYFQAAMLIVLLLAFVETGFAGSRADFDREVDAALERLYSTTPVAKKLAGQAEGILVFPDIIKAGIAIGGQYGEGALRQQGKTTGYYRSTAISYGLQAGAQEFGYVMFLMTKDALKYLESSDGWEVGVGPSLVLVDEGIAKNLTTTTAQDDIYAFIFGQKGLMAGVGLQGSRIKPIEPKD